MKYQEVVIKAISSELVGVHVPLDAIYDSVCLLTRIKENKEYTDNGYTDKVTGYTYECVETKDFNRISVKIDGQQKPLMTNERLQELRQAGERIFIEFENPTIFAYVNQKNVLTDSIKAAGVTLVNTEL